MLSPFTESLDTDSEVIDELEFVQRTILSNSPFGELPGSGMQSGEFNNEVPAGYENFIPSVRLDRLLYTGKNDWMNSPENLAIRKKVYEQHVANSRAAKKPYTYQLEKGQIQEVDNSGESLLKEAASSMDELLARARADLKKNNIFIRISSGYRTAEEQFVKWVKSFPVYYYWAIHKKGKSKNDIDGIARYIGNNLAAPGFSNHNHGLAVDFTVQEGPNKFNVDTNPNGHQKEFWNESYFWKWLDKHASLYHFYPYPEEPWHWEFKPRNGKTRQSSFPTPYIVPTSPVPLLIDWKEKAEFNNKYATRLGWSKYIAQISNLLFKSTNQLNKNYHSEGFAKLVQEWQTRNGFSVDNADGVIGPNTWKMMQSQLGIVGSNATKVSGINPKTVANVQRYNEKIERISKEFNLNPNIPRGIIAAESDGFPDTGKGTSGYKGLMQASRDETHLDPETSIRAGITHYILFRDEYFGPQLTRLGINRADIENETFFRMILCSYNAGQVAILKAVKYAVDEGDWKNWFEARHYQRGLLFAGAYSRYPSCIKGATSTDLIKAGQDAALYKFKKNWKTYPDPPKWEEVIKTISPLLRCWIETKYHKTPGYIGRIIAYYRYFESTLKANELEYYDSNEGELFSNYNNFENDNEEENLESGLSEYETEGNLSEFEMEGGLSEYDTEESVSEYEEEGTQYEEQSYEENESPLIAEENLTEQNRNYSSDLGWGNYVYEINDLLLKATGQSNMSLSGDSFNRAIALWRMKNGFPFWNISGLLDADAWKKMSATLGVSPLIFSVTDTFSKMGLRDLGLSFDAFRIACNGFRKLEKNGELNNNRILSIVDFTQSSINKRLYILDLAGQKLIFQTMVAHGSKSVKQKADKYYPTEFSNVSGSNKSSLGFYVTGKTFDMRPHNGEDRGLSLFIHGKEKDFNSNARARGIVIHPASYVRKGGPSWGCPALNFDVRDFVINTIKNGTCFFIYYTDANYLSKSTLAQDSSFGPLPALTHEYNEAEETEEESAEFDGTAQTEEQEEITEVEEQGIWSELEADYEDETPKKFDVDPGYGTTDYLKVSAVRGRAYLTGIFIPAGFKPSEKINIILYLHGMYAYGDKKNGIEYYWNNYSNIREHFYKSRRNAILLAPTLGRDPQAHNILLKDKNGLDTFITACFKELISKSYLPSSAEPFQLIIAGHSAGGSPMSRIMTNTNNLREHVIECWGFDCFYNYGWADVLGKNPGILFYHYWAYKNDGTKSGPGYNAEQLQKKFSNLKNISPSAGIHHPQVIGDAWVNEVNKRSWFSLIGAEEEWEFFNEAEMYEEGELAFEELVPVMTQPDIRKRIDDYFDLANAEYTIDTGAKVKSRSQFRYVTSGQALPPEDAKEKVKAQLRKTKAGVKFITDNSVAIHFAAYGRAKPSQIKIIIQALIDSGALADLRKIETTLTNVQLIRKLQRNFGMGIDCAGYVQLAFIFAYSGSDSDPAARRKKLGLKEKRGDEDLKSLPSGHFKKLDVLDAKTGDLLILNSRAGDTDRAGHTVIIVNHTINNDEHAFIVDASWGTDMYGLDAGGIGRRTIFFDSAKSVWWDKHPLDGTKANENTIGPYGGHPIQGLFRPKQEAKIVKEFYETGFNEAEDRNWSNTIRQNQYYANSLGWNQFQNQINDLLLPLSGLQNVSLGEEAFAQAVAAWQQQQGFSPSECDGIIGPHTWGRMKLFLSSSYTPAPVISLPPGVPSTQYVLLFNQWHAQKILDTMNSGFVGQGHDSKDQLEKIVRGEAVLEVNPNRQLIEMLPFIYHITEQAKAENYTQILIGSFIRKRDSNGSCTGHCTGNCIDINIRQGDFESDGAVQMVIKILGYLTSLPQQYRKRIGFGMPFQGSFFGHHSGLTKFKGNHPSSLLNPELRQLVPQLGIVFPDNDNHLHIQAWWP